MVFRRSEWTAITWLVHKEGKRRHLTFCWISCLTVWSVASQCGHSWFKKGGKKRGHLTFCWIRRLIVWSVCFSWWKNSGFAVPFTVFYIISSAKWIYFLFYLILYYFCKGKLLILVYLFHNSVNGSNSFPRIIFF